MANSSPSSNQEGSGGVPSNEDEKSHTFRKRRLSLSRHNASADSDASVSLASNHHHQSSCTTDQNSSNDTETPPLPAVVQTTKTTTQSREAPSAEFAADEKALTFRKRRLSLTLKARVDDEGEDGNNQGVTDATDPEELTTTNAEQLTAEGPPPTPPATRPFKRRASDASALSTVSTDGALRVRTLHADEIVAQHSLNCPPSPAVVDGKRLLADDGGEPHVLYRQSRKPSSNALMSFLDDDDDVSQQPKWRRRITRKLNDDERKLPFPRHIVGTFSCHGVEPIYDDIEYEQASTSDEEEDWSEDISGIKGAKSGQHFRLAKKKEPKPTTAAKINQDRGGVAFPYGNCPRTALFAAYDGHGQGGELVSQFALHEIQSRLEKHPEFPANLHKAFADTFLAVDKALHEEPLIDPVYAGTTACVALLRETTMTVANAGDSRAVIARRCPSCTTASATQEQQGAVSYQAIDLTVDQNPDLPEERLRIESMGGFVSPPPEPGLSARVWLDAGCSQIGLAMSRSLGDHAVAQVGVIADPVVSSHTVVPEDEFMIIATDGVWEFLSSDDAIKIVGDNLSRGATKACQALIEAAAAKWHNEEGDYRDDITALVIRLQELWKDKA